MTSELALWWGFLCSVAGLNVALWALAGWLLTRRRASADRDELAARRMQMLLCSGYVFGCAFRSVLPVYDVPRLCIVDTWLSSVIVGRSVATVAELCFAAQWALLARDIARATGDAVGARLARIVLPAIALAEICSWYSVLTTSNLGHVAEESLWGATAMMLVASFLAMRGRCDGALRRRLTAWAIAGAVYAIYMFAVDVPMYWMRWLADEAHGRAYLSLADGLADVARRWVVSHQWRDWRTEVVWMSLYFSVAVWLSIALVHAPRPRVAATRVG